MPGTLQTFSNPGGVPIATSADEFYQRQRLADQAQANNNAQLQAQLQDAAANRALQLQTMGSYADRARQGIEGQRAGFAHDASMEGVRGANALALGRQSGEFNLESNRVAAGPQQTRADLEVRQYGDGAPQRALAGRYAEVEGNLVSRLFGDQASATSGAPAAPTQPLTQDQMLKQWAVFKNPGSYGAAEQRAQEREDALAAQRSQVATALLSGANPQGRALGGRLLQGTPAFAGIDAAELMAGFAPVDAARNPQIMQRASVSGPINRAVDNFVSMAESNPKAATQQLSEVISQVQKAAADAGGDPEEAKAEIINKIDALVPKRSVASIVLRDIVRGLLPFGQETISNGHGINEARRQLGLP